MKDYQEMINEIGKNKTMTAQEKKEAIEKITEERIKAYEREYRINNAKNWIGGIIIILSSLIPATTILKMLGVMAKVTPAVARIVPIATKFLVSKIRLTKPLVNQIVANTLKKSAIEGGLAGGLYGIGESISTNKNFQESVEEISTSIINGIIANVMLSSAVLTLNLKFGSAKEILKIFDKRKDWGIAFRKASGNPKLAIEILLKNKKGFVPNVIYKKGIGDIDFPWGNQFSGLEHIITRRNKQNINGVNFVKNIPFWLNQGKVCLKKGHFDRKYIKYGNNELSIRTDFNKKTVNWIVSAYTKIDEVPLKAMSELRPLNNTYANRQEIPLSDLLGVPYNRIPNRIKKINSHVVKNIINRQQKVILITILYAIDYLKEKYQDKNEIKNRIPKIIKKIAKLYGITLSEVINILLNKINSKSYMMTQTNQNRKNLGFGVQNLNPQAPIFNGYMGGFVNRNIAYNPVKYNYNANNNFQNNIAYQQPDSLPNLYTTPVQNTNVENVPFVGINASVQNDIPQIQFDLPHFNSSQNKVELEENPISPLKAVQYQNANFTLPKENTYTANSTDEQRLIDLIRQKISRIKEQKRSN